MTEAEIIEKFKEVIKLAAPNLDMDFDNLSLDAELNTDLGLTSVSMLFTVIAIEEYFSISFDDVSFGDFRTVGDVVNYIKNKL